MPVDFSFSDNTVGYIIEGVMDKKAILELRAEILKKLELYQTINLYIEDNDIKKFTINAVIIAMAFPVIHSSRFNKIAMVTNRKWIQTLGAIDNFLIKGELKNFMIEDRMNAMTWIAEDNFSL